MSHYYVLEYETVDDYVNRRAPFREAHLRLLREAHQRGEVQIAGALGNPPDGALVVFRADSSAAAETFARQDPYVINGLITSWRVRQWHVVIGGDS